MRSMVRLGDKTHGWCTGHETPIEVDGIVISASEDTIVNGRGVARIGDKVRANCGHEGIIITGQSDAYINGRPHARIGDNFEGTYSGMIISASEDTY